MDRAKTFGDFVRKRRREMDLTQEELARRVGCAAITLRKIEADDLRASVQIAERLAMALAIPLEERADFVRWARSVRPASSELPPVTPPPSLEEIGREDLTGRAIRGYALAERIGMGGMGSVYRAVQPNVERDVAIKIILPAFADHPDFIRRFEAEAQLVARLEHPHIVPLYDYWREPGVAFLVMRLLRGGNIQNLLKEGPLSIQITAQVLEQICFALNAAHRMGVVHRDLKPANVLLDEDRNAYLADFGIAKNLGNPDFEQQTHVDAILGSPQYMSPEQIRSLAIRPQTDIYCLGVMLYEMLTGTLPFSGPTPFDLIQHHVNTPMPPLSAHRSGLPAALDAVIARSTAKDPEQRFSDVLSFFNEFRQAIGRLVDAHAVTITYEEEEPDAELINPFKGLRAFSEADAENFFGRETLIQQLLARLGEGGDLSRFLAVIGPSGSGKSSVVGAGLIPALRRGGLPGSENWFIVDMLPGRHPFEELEASLLRVAVNPPPSLLAQLKDGNRGILRAIQRILPADESIELVLVIDQFEEVFTLVEDEAERALLLGGLATAVMDERSRVRVIVTLRADFTDRPLRYVDFGEMLNRRFEFVLPLTPDEVERAVAGPAQRAGLRLEKGLVSTIIREAGNQPGTLPLLQHALSELFERREGRTLTNKAYREVGGVSGALVRSAEVLYALLDEPGKSATRELFLRLVTLGEGTEDTRRRVLREELEDLSKHNCSLPVVIEAYGRARLLSFDHDPITRDPTIEVAHEALLREWTRLRAWLNESRIDVRMQRQLATAAHEWHTAQHDPSFLITGARLEQFEGWVENSSVALTQMERAFLDASIQERDRREAEERAKQQRELENAQKLVEAERQRAEDQARSAAQLRKRALYLAGAFTAALIMALTAVFFGARARQAAITAKTQEQIATSRELAAASIANLSVDPERSILLALQAVDTAYTIEAEDALHRSVQTSRVQLVIPAHDPGAPMSVSFSPDGKRVATTSRDEVLKVWDAVTGKHLLTMEGHWAVFSPDGKRIASVVSNGTVKMWDATTGEEIPLPNQVDAMISVDFSPDGSRIATITAGLLPKVWDAETGKELVAFPGHTDFVSFVFFSPGGDRLLTLSDDGTARVWNAYTGEELLSLSRHPGIAENGAFSPDERRIATVGGKNGTDVYIWDAETGERLLTLIGHTDFVIGVDFSPDGTRIATASADGKAIVWDAVTGSPLFTLAGHSGAVVEAKFSPDGTHLASSSEDGTWRLWDITPGRELFTFFTHTDSSGQLAYSMDGKLLATTDENDMVKIRDALTGKELQSVPGSGKVYDLAFSPDGKHIVIANEDRTVQIWDVSTGKKLETLSGHTSFVNAIVFSKDGTRLVTAGEDYKIKIWDTSETPAKLLRTIEHPAEVRAAAFAPDGTRLVTGTFNGTAIGWDPNTGKSILDLSRVHSFSVSAVSFSPDGSRIVTASLDGTAKIWEATSGTELFTLRGHIGGLTSVAYSPDGKRIATASLDGTAKLWDGRTGQELLTLLGDGSGLVDVAFSPDGTRLATGSSTGVRVYLLQIDRLIALAQTRVTRPLTSDECQKYLHRDPAECASAATAPTTTAIPPTDQGRVCQVTDTSGLYDDSFNELIYKGLQNSHTIYGWDTRVLQSASISDIDRNFAEFQRGDCDLIIGTGGFSDALRAAALADPNQKFLLSDSFFDEPMANVWTQLYATDQAAFLAGYVAASVTRTGKVGIFGGIDIPAVTDFMDGFALGVDYYNQKNGTDVELLGWDVSAHEGLFVGGWCCAAEGRRMTQQLLDAGADIILPVAGTDVGSGALFAVKSHVNAYIIGVDTDWAITNPEYADIVLTSILKNLDVSVLRTVASIKDDTFTGGLHIGTLATGEVGLAPFYGLDSLIPSKVKADLEQIREDIIGGMIRTKP